MKFQKKSSILNVESEEEIAAAGVFYISEKKEKDISNTTRFLKFVVRANLRSINTFFPSKCKYSFWLVTDF